MYYTVQIAYWAAPELHGIAPASSFFCQCGLHTLERHLIGDISGVGVHVRSVDSWLAEMLTALFEGLALYSLDTPMLQAYLLSCL